MKNIPVNTPLLIGNEKKYLLKCIKTGFISSAGNYVRKFEEKFAKFIGKNMQFLSQVELWLFKLLMNV